jgi:enoyl-CoA hydratase
LNRTKGKEEANAIGLVDEIFPQEELIPKVIDYARSIANGAPFAIVKIKKCINEASICLFQTA